MCSQKGRLSVSGVGPVEQHIRILRFNRAYMSAENLEERQPGYYRKIYASAYSFDLNSFKFHASIHSALSQLDQKHRGVHMTQEKLTPSNANLERIDVEGLDDSTELEMRDYPLDSLLIRSEPRSVHEVCRRISKGNYIMDPDFQRDFVWNQEKQSKLIESMLMRIPLPVFYLAERDDGKVIVIDGLQRLTTISRFLDNKFSLRHLDEANELFRGKYFRDLSPKLQNRLEDSQLIIYVLDEKVPERARLDIFERVNGGTPLSRQQMRNCLYSGPATRLLASLTQELIFLKATGNSLSRLTMRDREFINRFMGFFLLPLDNYKGDMDLFLASTLKFMNQLSSGDLQNVKNIFLRSMSICYSIWDKHCFRKHLPGQGPRSIINAALFDILSVAVARDGRDATEKRKEKYRNALFDLFEDDEFVHSITYSTNSLRQVEKRFRYAMDAFGAI